MTVDNPLIGTNWNDLITHHLSKLIHPDRSIVIKNKMYYNNYLVF
jgi:hypothetical protein